MPGNHTDARPAGAGALGRLLGIAPGEWRRAAWSGLYHFMLLGAWYMIRPVREEIGAEHTDHLQWIWTGTFLAMLVAVPVYTAIVARVPRQVFVPLTYGFFALVLAVFHWLIAPASPIGPGAEIAFYITASVFNLFVVSVFWQFMADIHHKEQSKRLFGLLAVGGTLGTIVASALAALLTDPPEVLAAIQIRPHGLLLIGSGLLIAAALCAVRLHFIARTMPGKQSREADQPVRGTVREGLLAVARSPYLLGICAFVALHSFAGTFVYYRLADLANELVPDRGERAAFYASISLWANLIVITMQLLATGRLLRHVGVGVTLVVLPFVNMLGFAAVAAFPGLAAVAGFDVARRAADYALAKPAREVLFTTVPRRDKYKAKALIDNAVYRGADCASGFIYRGVELLAAGPAIVAVFAIPVVLIWGGVGMGLGRAQERTAKSK